MVSFRTKQLSLTTLIFLLATASLYAQVLKKATQKIRSSKNISYTDIVQTKFSFQEDFSADTLRSNLFLKPGAPLTRSYYLLKGSHNTYAFDGNKMIGLNLTDSTYYVQKESVDGQNTRTLLYWAETMDKLSGLPSAKIIQLPDTIINNTTYTNIRVTESDTIENNERLYTLTNLIIDKQTSLPLHIIRRLKGHSDDGSIIGMTEIHTYSNYKLDQTSFPDLSVALIPKFFKLPVKRVPAKFLSNGTIAPAIKAYDLLGNTFDLEKLKGKTVLLNFSLIGCPHCVGAAQMLNRLHDKYKEAGLVIINIYPIDEKEVIGRFDKAQNVKTNSYTSDRAVQKIYPYDGYPSFYLLDKAGLVAQSYNGYYKALELEIIGEIQSLNKK
jgi:thiol-disulfide isomerase/thioredoxin